MSVRPAKTQISLGIRAVWSEHSLCAKWVAKIPSFLHADSEDSDQTGRMPRLIWVSAGCTLILLVLSWCGSFEDVYVVGYVSCWLWGTISNGKIFLWKFSKGNKEWNQDFRHRSWYRHGCSWSSSRGFPAIDALDATKAMLSIAKKENLYDNYYCEFLSGEPLSCFEQDTYNGLTASGCFARNHIPSEALREIIRLVKPGGIIVIVSRPASPVFDDHILTLIDILEQEGKWKKLVAETSGRYFLKDEAIVWKYQVLKSS